MKRMNFLLVGTALVLLSSLLLACATSTQSVAAPTAAATIAMATTAPATVAATTVPPTSAPATTAPTATTAATNTPAATNTAAADADKAVTDALTNFKDAKSFALDASVQTTPIFFQANYTPGPGEDPNVVNIFTLKGHQNNGDLSYETTGFLASFLGLVNGFDPTKSELGFVKVGDKVYMRGTLDGETEAKWFLLPEDKAKDTQFAPEEIILTFAEVSYPKGSWTQSGTETMDGQTCNIYSANRAAIDEVFKGVAPGALLNEDELKTDGIDDASYRIWVCPDGNIARIEYKLDAHAKSDATKKGMFLFDAKLSDIDSADAVQAPTDAIPMPSATPSGSATSEPSATKTVTNQSFSSTEGEWEGTSGDDLPLTFTVENKAVTFANINYAVGSGSCSASGAIGKSVEDAPITNSTFKFVLTDSDNVAYTVTGTFDSNNAASGTINIKGKTFCGDTDETVKWTANHVSSPDQEGKTPEATQAALAQATATASATATLAPTNSPTPRPTSSPTVRPTSVPTAVPTAVPTVAPTVAPTPDAAAAAQNMSIVNSAFAAIAANNLEGALQYFDDNVVYNIVTISGTGKDGLRSNFQLAKTMGTNLSISNIQAQGNTVTFTAQASGFLVSGTYPNSSVTIENGKVKTLDIR